MDINHGETPRELYVRLKDLFNKWVKPESSTVKEISELLILEQFLRMVGPELEVWIHERDQKFAEEATRLAEVFLSARTGSRRTTFGRDNYFTGRSKSNGGERGGQAQVRPHSSARQFSPNKPGTSRKSFSGSRQDTRCYQCNEIGPPSTHALPPGKVSLPFCAQFPGSLTQPQFRREHSLRQH